MSPVVTIHALLVNLLYHVIDILFYLLDFITSLFPWSCPIEPFIQQLGGVPAIVVSWVTYFLPLDLMAALLQGFLSIWALVVLFRLLLQLIHASE